MVRGNWLFVSLFVALLLFGGARPAPAQDTELKALKGEWKAVSMIESGKRRDPSYYHFPWITFFPGQRKVKMPYASDACESFESTFAIDASKTPHALDVTGEDGKPRKGIYKIEGDELWINFGSVGDKRPNSFDGKKDTTVIYKKK
jgi:uncharacterized protein (TIGR03067 family)